MFNASCGSIKLLIGKLTMSGILLVTMANICYSQTFFPCGTDNNETQIDTTFVTWSLLDFQTTYHDPLLEEPDTIIPLAILLVDPLPEWNYTDLYDLLSNSLHSFREEWLPYNVSFNIGVVEEITNAQLSSRYLYYRENMHVLVVVNATSTVVPSGSCGAWASWYPNRVAIRFAPSCASHVDDGKAFGFVHEFGHNLGLGHTFNPGNGGSDYDVYTVMRPDSSTFYNINPSDTTLTAGVDFVGDSTACNIRGDRFCSTLTEINPGDREMWHDNGIQFYVRHPLPHDSLQQGKNIYTPNYEVIPWYSDKTVVSYVTDSNGNDIELPPCSLAAINFRDWRGNLYEDVFAEKGYYNIMSYGGEACPAHFELEQLDSMNTRLNRLNSPTPAVQDVITKLVIKNDGDNDIYQNTFSSLDSAAAFIQNHWMNKYIIYVKSDSSNVGNVSLDSDWYQGDNIVPGLYDNIVPRFLDIQMIGVESVDDDGNNPVIRTNELAILSQSGSTLPIKLIGNIKLAVKGIKFELFGNGRQFGTSVNGVVINFQGTELQIENCAFSDNGLNSTTLHSLCSCKGVIHFAPMQEPKLRITNCLFTDNVAPAGPAVAIGMSNVPSNVQEVAVIENCTFHNNTYTDNAINIGALHVQSLGQTVFKNDLFSGSDPNNGTPGNQTAITIEHGIPTSIYATIKHCLFDQDEWIDGYFNEGEIDSTNIIIDQSESVGYVNSNDGDFRLKWNSIAVDNGDPSLSDYDMTKSDIGWSPVYAENEISGNHTISERGWYKLVGDATISGTDTVIPEGTTIRNDDAHYLHIRDTNSSNGYNITIGDPDGARTAIVGSPEGGITVFGSTATAPALANTAFNGVLFNQASTFGNGCGLWFTYCNVDLNGANGNVKFANVDHTEMVFDEICLGQFRNFNFDTVQVKGTTKGIGCIDVQYSDVDILNIVFDPITGGNDPWYWKVMHYGTVPGNPTHIIANCAFDATDNELWNVPLMISEVPEMNLHHNTFENVQYGAISMATTQLIMNNGAANSFYKYENSQYDTCAIIRDWSLGTTDLKCGYNSFIDEDINQGNMYIVSGCASDDWSNNFWGTDCDTDVSPAGHIPQCVQTYSPWLSTCPTLFTPCDGQDDESELYALGEEADSLYNYESALSYWFELLTGYPESKYCTGVTSSIKAIGLLTEYGAETYGQIRTDLEDAAGKSASVDELLSVYQVCSAWCVEGYYGDREEAIALLDSLYEEKELDKDMKMLISAALAEIDTYPPQGQGSAMNPRVEMARLIRRQERLHDLYRVLVPSMSAKPLATQAVPVVQVPTRFGITSCHPNPFNPVTMIEVEVLQEDPLTLEIYNVMGQRVEVLHQGTLTVGLHQFQWNAEARSSGLYIVQARQGTRTDNAKIMLVR